MTRHFLRDHDLSPAEQQEVLAATLKRAPYDSRSLACGALAGIGKRESVADVERVLGRQASVIVWRTYAQNALDERAANAGVPVVNALTDESHPCQLLADLLTIREIAAETGGSAEVMVDPREAVTGADVVGTDTWASMGKEEAAARLAAFGPYTVTADLLSLASSTAIVTHCLPAYRGKEIDADVLDGPQSGVWDEAENRRHAQKAIITWLLHASTQFPDEEAP